MPRWSTAALLLSATLLLPSMADAQHRYTVRSGDTLIAIARRYHVGVEALQDANSIRGERIRPGQRLRIPRRGGRRFWNGVYTVRDGDTLSRIARRYRVSVRDLQRANRLRGAMIRPGTRLRIPGRGMGRQRPEGARPQELDGDQTEALARAEQLGLGTSRVAHTLLTEAPEPAWVEAAGERDPRGTVLVPVENGAFLRGWGSGAGHYHLALDVGADPGTPVRAGASGIVAYAGRAVRGYGNTVIVVHPNGWVTWYAHNRQNLVVPGQLVERGEVIATVGATGYARGAHVHFMLLYEGRHCDPAPILDGGFTNHDPDVETTRWTDARPSSVRCAPKRSHPRRRHRRRRRRR